MTQSSRPNQDHQDNGYLDAGPYSRDQWAKKLIIEWVGDAITTRGPFARFLNRLAVTNPAGVTIRVDTGAGYVGGTLLDVTAAITFTPDTPAIAARIDKVVMVLNNTNAAYTGAVSGVVLDFPTDLTDYAGAASVPAYSARLAILRGDDATGAATALIQTAAYYMVELYRYTISNVPAVSVLTDNRDYVDATMKSIFIKPSGAYDATAAAQVQLTYDGLYGGDIPVALYLLPEDHDCVATGEICFPDDYVSAMSVKALVYDKALGGNIYAGWEAIYAGACGEDFSNHAIAPGVAVIAIANDEQMNQCVAETSVGIGSYGDTVYFYFFRNGADVLDTQGDLGLSGFIVEYLGVR